MSTRTRGNPETVHVAYPIHCSGAGKPGGFTTKGESRKYFNSSGVYLIAMTSGTT
jgi:hypothetical protein